MARKKKSKVKKGRVKKSRRSSRRTLSKRMHTAEEKMPRASAFFAILAYILQLANLVLIGSGAVLSIIIYLVGEKKFTRFHALQATFFGFVVSLMAYILKDGLVTGNTIIPEFNNPLFYSAFVVTVIAAVIVLSFRAFRHEMKEIPLFGHLSMRYT